MQSSNPAWHGKNLQALFTLLEILAKGKADAFGVLSLTGFNLLSMVYFELPATVNKIFGKFSVRGKMQMRIAGQCISPH